MNECVCSYKINKFQLCAQVFSVSQRMHWYNSFGHIAFFTVQYTDFFYFFLLHTLFTAHSYAFNMFNDILSRGTPCYFSNHCDKILFKVIYICSWVSRGVNSDRIIEAETTIPKIVQIVIRKGFVLKACHCLPYCFKMATFWVNFYPLRH